MSDPLKSYMHVALGQVRKRIAEERTQNPDSPILESLILLEELIKEQMPHENPDHPARPAR